MKKEKKENSPYRILTEENYESPENVGDNYLEQLRHTVESPLEDSIRSSIFPALFYLLLELLSVDMKNEMMRDSQRLLVSFRPLVSIASRYIR